MSALIADLAQLAELAPSFGFMLLSSIPVLRFMRDLSHTRRIGAAEAQQAEAAAQRAITHADLCQWLVDEAKVGRPHMPSSELIDVIARPQIHALSPRQARSNFNYSKEPASTAFRRPARPPSRSGSPTACTPPGNT